MASQVNPSPSIVNTVLPTISLAVPMPYVILWLVSYDAYLSSHDEAGKKTLNLFSVII